MSLGAIPINDGEMIPYLIRGLYRPGIRSVLMGNTPVTINAFLTELRRLELISESPSDSAVAPSDPSSSMSDNDSNSLSLATKALTNQVAYLTRNEKQPAVSKPSLKQVSFDRRPPGIRNEIQCYNCSGFGYFARDCPHPNSCWQKSNSENVQAARRGRSGSKYKESPRTNQFGFN